MKRSTAASIIRERWPDSGRVHVLEVVEQPDGSVDVLMQTRAMPGRGAGRPLWLNLSAQECGRGTAAASEEVS